MFDFLLDGVLLAGAFAVIAGVVVGIVALLDYLQECSVVFSVLLWIVMIWTFASVLAFAMGGIRA